MAGLLFQNTFRELAIKNAPKQATLVDYLVEKAPVLGVMPFQETSNGLYHNFEKLLDVTGPKIVGLDEVLPHIKANTEIGQVKIDSVGGQIEVGIDKLQSLNKSAADYFDSNLQPALRQAGSDFERGILYNHLRRFALEAVGMDFPLASLHALDAGGTGSTNYSLIVVKWDTDNLYGLYDPTFFGRGMAFDLIPVSNGATYKNEAGQLVRGIAVKSNLGVLTANPRNVSTIVNIDVSSANSQSWKIPDQYKLSDAIEAVDPDYNGNTMVLCHPIVANRLFGSLKTEVLTMTVPETNYSMQVRSYNGIPIITSGNFLPGNEPKVTLPS